jgi:DNA-binding NarL/FixJ family response regulator
MRQIRVMLVDDHKFLRDVITEIINNQPDMLVIGEAANGKIAVEMHPVIRPDITIMDINMPEMNGVDAISNIRKEDPDARFIVLTGSRVEEEIRNSLDAGARAYILKEQAPLKLVSMIRAVTEELRLPEN